MAKKVQRKYAEGMPAADATHTPDTKTRKQKDKSWEERLRLTGDARFTEVAWSGRDHPSWPLPRK